MKLYKCRLEVRGYELDSFGHVNHAVYLNYFEHARWQMLNEEGITHEWIAREKLWPVIAKIEIKYIKPAFLGDELEVRTHITEQGRARFTLEQSIFKGDTLITSAQVHSVVINEKGRPVEIPAPYAKLWQKE